MTQTQTEQSQDQVSAVSRTIAAPPLHVWEVLVSHAGAEALLGHGADIGAKGQSWHNDEGAMGVVRSVHPIEQIRVSWHETPEAPRTMVEIGLAADGDGTRVELTHAPVVGDVDEDSARWAAALERFEGVVLG